MAKYLELAFPQFQFLRQHWDELRMRGAIGEDASHDASAMTAVLQDPYFFAYWKAQKFLRDQLHEFMSWSEGCPCHESLRKSTAGPGSEKLRLEIVCPATVPCHCPLMGCRGPELACNKAKEFCDSLPTLVETHTAQECTDALSVQKRQCLVEETQRGVNALCSSLAERMFFWQGLPWKIIGGAHADQDKARGALARARELWGGMSMEERGNSHWLARELFQEGPLRAELEEFLRSDMDLSSLPLLEAFLAPLVFIPTAERIIEATHKDMSAASRGQGSLNGMSLQLRVPELLRSLAVTPGKFAALLDAFEEIRYIRAFPTAFPGHGYHPEWLRLGKRAQTSRYVSVVSHIVYRDASMQHASLGEAAREHRKHKLKKKVDSVDLDMICLRAAVEYIRLLAKEDPQLVFTDSVGSLCSPTLLRPSAIHRPNAHASGVQQSGAHHIVCVALENQGAADLPKVSSVRKGVQYTLDLKEQASQRGMQEVLRSIRVWEQAENLEYSLELGMHNRASTSRVLSQLLLEGAVPGGGGVYRPAEDDATAVI